MQPEHRNVRPVPLHAKLTAGEKGIKVGEGTFANVYKGMSRLDRG
jgi:hypothetical protein